MDFSFDNTTNVFLCDDIEYIPKIRIDSEYNYNEYDVYFYYNKFASENDIYQVTCEGHRIGYIFPVEAIESNEHDKANDEYFLKYAFVAINLLLKKLEASQFEEPICLSDLFSDVQLLIICKENLRNNNLELEDYLLSLSEYGYSKNSEVYFPKRLLQLDVKNKFVILHKIQKDIDSISYIKEEFYNLLPLQSDNPLIIFHRLYQFIEILIMELFNLQFGNFLASLDLKQDDLFQKKEDLDKMTGEKKRISTLLNQCPGIDITIKNNLNNACQRILNLYNHKISKDYAVNLYEVRCCLFHSLYKFKKENESYLLDINQNLFLTLISIISSISFEKILKIEE